MEGRREARGTYRGLAGGACDLRETASEPGVAPVADQVYVHVHLGGGGREGGREDGREGGKEEGRGRR